MQSFTDVMDAWPNDAEFAADAGVSKGLVACWRHRNSVPRNRFGRIIAAATQRGIAGITYPELDRLHEARWASCVAA